MTKFHYLSYARLVRVVSNMEKVYSDLKLKSTGVSTPVDKLGKTPLKLPSRTQRKLCPKISGGKLFLG